MGGIGAHEDVTDDDIVEVVGEVSSHDSHDALGLGSDGLLEDVVVGGEDVLSGVEGEGDVGEGVQVGAVLFDGDAGEEGLEKGVGSHDEGSAGVDGGHVTGGIDVAVGAGHLGEVDVPVGLFNNLMGGDLLEAKLLIEAGHGHVGSLWVVLHVEGEGFVLNVGGGGHEGGEVVHRDGVEAESNDTVHLGDKEGAALDLLDLTEAHSGGDVLGDLGGVLGGEASDGAGAVGDVEVGAVSNIGVRLGAVVLGVSKASSGVAVAGVDPQVGGTGVGDDGELLVVASDGHIDEVLGVHVVLHGDVLSLSPSLSALDDLLLLGHVISNGEVVHVEGDFVGGHEASDGGDDGCGELHNCFDLKSI